MPAAASSSTDPLVANAPLLAELLGGFLGSVQSTEAPKLVKAAAVAETAEAIDLAVDTAVRRDTLEAVAIVWLEKAKITVTAGNVRAVTTACADGHMWFPKSGKSKDQQFICKEESAGTLALKWLAECTLTGTNREKMLSVMGLGSATIDNDVLKSWIEAGFAKRKEVKSLVGGTGNAEEGSGRANGATGNAALQSRINDLETQLAAEKAAGASTAAKAAAMLVRGKAWTEHDNLVVVVEGPPPSKCPLPLHAASKCTKCYPPSGGDEAAAVVMCYPKFSVQKRPGDKQIQLAVKRAHVDLQPPVSEDDKTLFMRVEKTAWLPEAPLTDRRLANPLTIQAKSFSAATDVGPSSWQLRFGLAVEDVEEEYREPDLTPPTATG